MVVIKGIQKTSMLDYPGKISTVLFTSKCNMKCPFCQNPSLVEDSENLPELDHKRILSFLEERKNWINGVCITGGEPLIYEGITELMKKIKDIGLNIKLDTNGLNPELLKKIIGEKLVDYIAMDIKSDKKHYKEASGADIDLSKIEQSIELIKNSGIDYEFRSTVVPDFFDEDVMKNIAEWLKGSKKYCLQQFRPTTPLLDKAYEEKKPFDANTLNTLKDIAASTVKEVELRA